MWIWKASRAVEGQARRRESHHHPVMSLETADTRDIPEQGLGFGLTVFSKGKTEQAPAEAGGKETEGAASGEGPRGGGETSRPVISRAAGEGDGHRGRPLGEVWAQELGALHLSLGALPGGASLNGAHRVALVPHLVPVLPPSPRDQCDKEGLLSHDDQKEGKQGAGAAVGKLRRLVEKVGETHPHSRQWGHF